MKKIAFLSALFLFAGAALFSQDSGSGNGAGGEKNYMTKDNMVLIKGGSFVMGSPASEAWREKDEVQHTVTLDDFYISKYEVTQAEYESVMKKNPSYFKGAKGENLPVESVSWYDAVAFCNELSRREGLSAAYTIDGETVVWNRSADGYRLPTESEWEYAARAGTSTPFSSEKAPGDVDANFYAHYPYNIEQNYFNDSVLETRPGYYRQKTVAVGSFKPNANGLYDIHGNVSEWCFDFYGAYPKTSVKNPSGAEDGSTRVCRGGGWNDFGKHLRCAFRSSELPEESSASRGFRVARNK
ncbi:Sulphatase-modifying factor protein [Treponema brennaborense DSM 12168]|uniref:Sulphatase-modifying factor protein n=2 Tax=Treponema TaxID=157 RepID=F4LLW9_TREBD|nr:Sulphatase-modifying factor protein [Treponema brennaborense DSM 12168]